MRAFSEPVQETGAGTARLCAPSMLLSKDIHGLDSFEIVPRSKNDAATYECFNCATGFNSSGIHWTNLQSSQIDKAHINPHNADGRISNLMFGFQAALFSKADTDPLWDKTLQLDPCPRPTRSISGTIGIKKPAQSHRLLQNLFIKKKNQP